MAARSLCPTVRRAAHLMPPGPERDDLFARARQFFADGPGPFIELRITAVQRALEMIWATQVAQRNDNPAQAPAQAREHLRYENQLDRLNRAHAAAWEDAFHDARDAVFRETGKRLATPVFEADENWHALKNRLYHDAYYARHRPALEAAHRAEAAPRPPEPAPETQPTPQAETAPELAPGTAPAAQTTPAQATPAQAETPRQAQPGPEGKAPPDFTAVFEAVRRKIARSNRPPQPPRDPQDAA